MTTPSRGSQAGIDLAAKRDREALLCLARLRKLSSAHLEGFTFEGTSVGASSRGTMTRRILRGLRERGLIALSPRVIGRPGAGSTRAIYQLTEAGRRYVCRLDSTFGASRPAPREAASIEHALMAADVALAFVRAARRNTGHDVSDWEPDWRAVELLGSSRVVPDGYLVYETRAWEIGAFIEIDLGTERSVRFGKKVAEYVGVLRRGTWRAQMPSWPLVLTVTPTAARAALLRRTTENVLRRERDAERLERAAEFDFTTLPDLLRPEGPLGRIWQVAGREGLQSLLPSSGDAAVSDAAHGDVVLCER